MPIAPVGRPVRNAINFGAEENWLSGLDLSMTRQKIDKQIALAVKKMPIKTVIWIFTWVAWGGTLAIPGMGSWLKDEPVLTGPSATDGALVPPPGGVRVA